MRRPFALMLLLAGCDAALAPEASYDPGVPGSVDQAMCRLGFLAVPMRTLVTGHHLVDARLNGQPARFIVDTGANISVISRRAAERLGLEASAMPVGAVVGIGGNQRVGIARVRTLELGGMDIDRRTLVTADLSQLETTLGRISQGGVDGLIGQDVMTRHRAVIDVPRALLYLAPRPEQSAANAPAMCETEA